MKSKLNIIRRALTSALLAVASLFVLPVFAEHFTEGKQVPPTTEKLKPGDFVWEPERAPEGPVLIVVSKPEQIAYVYRNGIRIARSSVSTGRPGHPTPVGVFDILEKEKDHRFDDLQRRGDAVDGAVDVDRDRAARGRSAGLSGFARLRAPAAGVFQAALHRDDQGRYGDHCG